MKPPPRPGDDVCAVPPPVVEEPPNDRFCDLVLTGGVASGVVYPWAIVELARHFRFRNIGGTSVGAMAAALAAAAEYGRRTGVPQPFETLRRLPGILGEELDDDGRTRMLSLFQAEAPGQRLIDLWGKVFNGSRASKGSAKPVAPQPPQPPRPGWRRWLAKRLLHLLGKSSYKWLQQRLQQRRRKPAWVSEVAKIYKAPLRQGAIAGALVAAVGPGSFVGLALAAQVLGTALSAPLIVAVADVRAWVLVSVAVAPALVLVLVLALLLVLALAAAVGALVGLGIALWFDLRDGLVRNGLGLCKGGTVATAGADADPDRPGLVEWLHEGIQRSAGLELTDLPLTFGDLWCAPAQPGSPPAACSETDPAGQRSINLQMLTTNVTHGRPYRLPHIDTTCRLFYVPAELESYLPRVVLDALVAASLPYEKRTDQDPSPSDHTRRFLELPGAELPIVVAARLSLSFPLLFSAVPLYAIDFETEVAERRKLKRCWFTDGGVSSNFPIHLFDSALPRWPTFGLWLDRHNPDRDDVDVWLPPRHHKGWGDGWNRFDAAAAAGPEAPVATPNEGFGLLFGFLKGLVNNATDWRDLTSFRMPHVRNRVARLYLRPGEGGLQIGMPRRQILLMAGRYGTTAGRMLVNQFVDRSGGEAAAWSEQRWVRLQLLISGLRERLSGVSSSAAYTAHSRSMRDSIERARHFPPLREEGKIRNLDPDQADSLERLMAELERLEGLLDAAQPQSYRPVPDPELRLRPPL